MFVVVEMPKYKPPNPLWQSEYDGESINMIFACLVSEEFILNGGKEDGSHDLWASVVAGEEENIQQRMKMICKLRNPSEFATSTWDRSIIKKFNATPLLVKPQHEFQLGTLDR